MADNQLTIGIKADSSQLRADLAVASAQLAGLGKELRAAAAESLKTGDTTHVKGLADAFELARGRVSSLKSELAEVGGGAGREAIKSLGEAIKSLGEEGGRLGGAFSVLGPAITLMTTGLTGLATAGVAAGAALFELAKHAAENTRQIENTAADLGLTAEEYEKLKFAFLRFGASAEGVDRSLERMNASIGKGALRCRIMAPAFLGMTRCTPRCSGWRASPTHCSTGSRPPRQRLSRAQSRSSNSSSSTMRPLRSSSPTSAPSRRRAVRHER